MLAALRTRLAFFVLPLFFISYIVKVTVGNIPFTLLELLVDGLFGIWLIRMVWNFEYRTELISFLKREFTTLSPTMLFAGLFILTGASLLFVPKETIGDVGDFTHVV